MCLKKRKSLPPIRRGGAAGAEDALYVPSRVIGVKKKIEAHHQ
jgi:hypothetical protein